MQMNNQKNGRVAHKFLVVVMVAVFVLALTPTAAIYANETVTATPTTATVLIDGVAINFTAYNISGRNYFRLRDIAYALNGTERQFEVNWHEQFGIRLILGGEYTPIGGELGGGIAGNRPALPVTVEFDMREFVYGHYNPLGRWIYDTNSHLAGHNIDGSNFVSIRDLGRLLNFGVEWDGAANAILIDTTRGYFAPDVQNAFIDFLSREEFITIFDRTEWQTRIEDWQEVASRFFVLGLIGNEIPQIAIQRSAEGTVDFYVLFGFVDGTFQQLRTVQQGEEWNELNQLRLVGLEVDITAAVNARLGIDN